MYCDVRYSSQSLVTAQSLQGDGEAPPLVGGDPLHLGSGWRGRATSGGQLV